MLLALNPKAASGALNPGWPLWFTGRADEALPYMKDAYTLSATTGTLD